MSRQEYMHTGMNTSSTFTPIGRMYSLRKHGSRFKTKPDALEPTKSFKILCSVNKWKLFFGLSNCIAFTKTSLYMCKYEHAYVHCVSVAVDIFVNHKIDIVMCAGELVESYFFRRPPL
ncbi:hypothetical protein HELRODRAFT_160385 [Helobdella robusta]|uniref:Uncharacterized protein n=1 Tax=Helobdella robusta TaxID=6412 RepID=T1EQ67_HELRO|nr:hypothetical protein HELRODRAFT_160385 [Helobdella robusta]ESO06227.1 hypothetical protein HELRODRAFT_160385 [Helobdella robusta]